MSLNGRLGQVNLHKLRDAIAEFFLADEAKVVSHLLRQLQPLADDDVSARARDLARTARQVATTGLNMQVLAQLYDLGTKEGRLLLSLAEALPRIPDEPTALDLLQDKLSRGHWSRRRLRGPGPAALAVGLGVAAKWIAWAAKMDQAGNAMILGPARKALDLLAREYVFAENIRVALRRAQAQRNSWYSFDMLGEAALTYADADDYFHAYLAAIESLRTFCPARQDGRPPTMSMSVKLSALYPRFEVLKGGIAVDAIAAKLKLLALAARDVGTSLTLDAEEAERLDMTLDVFERVYRDTELSDWNGLGVAVQAYQKRATAVLDWLVELALHVGKRIAVRLVKGAYWDTEVKLAQQGGLSDFPVFTHKAATDLSYLVCAQKLLNAGCAVYPQFATHNAYSVAFLLSYAGNAEPFEFQRLHGMGAALYGHVAKHYRVPCRIYSPVGETNQLLPYLVRRLLENGANSSFVNQIADTSLSLDEIIVNPTAKLLSIPTAGSRAVRPPIELYAPERRNSAGVSFADRLSWLTLRHALQEHLDRTDYQGYSLVGGKRCDGPTRQVRDPADHGLNVGQVTDAAPDVLEKALASTYAAGREWSQTPVAARARVLDHCADRLEADRSRLVALLVREAGKCIPDAVAEYREAVDLLRYYAAEGRRLCSSPQTLPASVGEQNTLALHGRGVFLCISPWNFPLAIFIGQVAAALVTGNTVIAKPSEQTSLVATIVAELLLQSGLPADALALLTGSGQAVAAPLVADERVAGVCFTGSTATAKVIQRSLAAREGPVVPLIAETGGINALLADSTAHHEQLVRDIMASAFNSAGQRCSALRLLLLQTDTADLVLARLAGAMATLSIGRPAELSTDVGPIIDGEALGRLHNHVEKLDKEAVLVQRCTLTAKLPDGNYFAPCVYEIPAIDWLNVEVFGPVLHVVRFAADEMDNAIDALNAKRFGLTLGIHTRNETTIHRITDRARVGNAYVNRNMIGAVVGSQPFGGEGLSGTGPKAGGPNYLMRFVTERVVSTNTAAIGGDPDLLSQI